MISFDEWNVWYLRGDPQDAPMKHKENRLGCAAFAGRPLLFLDALVVGGLLCSLINHCDRVKMASLAQLVNVIAPIFTEAGGGVIRQTIFWPFAMVANVAKGSALRHFILRAPSAANTVTHGASSLPWCTMPQRVNSIYSR
jgi:alpha-N-arabinofuranosidase